MGDHRPGQWKQTNKAHKTGRHRSKGAIDNATKGKVDIKVISRKRKIEPSRVQRRKFMKQIRKIQHVDATFAKKQQVECGSPHLVCILPMNQNIDSNSVLDILTTAQAHEADKVLGRTETGVTYFYNGLLKQKFAFLVPPIGQGNELRVLDFLRVADTTLMVTSANGDHNEFFDSWGHYMFNLMSAQGIPTPTLVLMDLLSVNPKKRQNKLEAANKFMKQYFPKDKLLTLGTESETKKILRMLSDRKKLPLPNTKNRPHMFSEAVEYVASTEADSELGTLKVTGFLRGATLDVNSLVHITELGDFQISHIEGLTDPFRLNLNPKLTPTCTLLQQSDPAKQQSLQAENIPDPMDAEQTWPTEEEIEMSKQENIKMKSVKLVPKGWSSYQAAWIPDVMDKFDGEGNNLVFNESDEENGNEYEAEVEAEDDNDDDDEFMSCDGDLSEEQENTVETVTDPSARLEERYDNQMDFQEERDTLKMLQDSRVDQMYPDEIDTPLDVNARDRFKKYRGLESFRTSPWDPKENLPKDYARIYQFKSFDHTKRRILAESKNLEMGVKQGNFITLHIKNVPATKWNQYLSIKSCKSLIVFGLLPHEHRMSVMNVVLKRTDDSNQPIKSKDRLLIQCGYRRFYVNPIFSQHTNGAKHKYERYFQPNTTVCATFYAPIQYPPAPVLAFTENANSSLTFVARGNVLSCNPDRIVLKRVVLSGHPMRINRKSATVRYMFFNKEDVNYFKPIKLRTKCGRIGHIKESLGTHGHMKCIFDGQLRSIDCVFMHLYKRIYPKWTYTESILSSPTIKENKNNLVSILKSKSAYDDDPMQE